MIRSIRIQNFRSLRDVNVEFSPITVLVGQSGTGKSNFVAAIRFLRDYLSAFDNPAQFPWKSLQCATNLNGPIEFDVRFELPGLRDEFAYSLRLSGGNGSLVEEKFAVNGETAFEQDRQVSKSGPLGPHRWLTPPPLQSPPDVGLPALGRLPGLETASLAYSAMTMGIGIYDFPPNVLTATTPEKGRRFGLDDHGGNFLDVLQELAANHHRVQVRKAIAAALAKINPTVSSIDIDSIRKPQHAIVGHRLDEKLLTLSLEQESSGFRRFYAYLLALYQLPSKLLLIFEEPENGIHPGALSLLAEELKSAPAEDRGQVILTTHSPALLDHFSADEIRVVELKDLETKIGPLSPEQQEALSEHLLQPGELLTVDPARIDNAGEVVVAS